MVLFEYMKKTITLLGVLVLALIIIGAIIYISPRSADDNSNKMQNTENTISAPLFTTVSEGKGVGAASGDTITVNYTGKFQDGKVFDTSIGKQPFSFTIGAGQVIRGWDEGLVGMKVGGTRLVAIPPELGYGANAVGQIPANSTLIFQVELVSIGAAPAQPAAPKAK